MQRNKATLPQPLANSLRELDTSLTDATNRADILPKTVTKIAPNQGTWNETAEVMGVKRKGAKKRRNTDGYCGGESSGKAAHPDARVAKKPRTVSSAPASPPAPASLANEDTPFDGGVDTQYLDAPVATEMMLPPDDAASLQSAEAALRQALGLYNQMFPPVSPDTSTDTPRPTSYYRDHCNYAPRTTVANSFYRTH
ncbi:hypothetical protein B0H14DRAFT_2577797 [Mycena olivaceomarginata]|nr:hypothetical protein B0H14DRAFT_2577797 [Mycena olivaceomarginata]